MWVVVGMGVGYLWSGGLILLLSQFLTSWVWKANLILAFGQVGGLMLSY